MSIWSRMRRQRSARRAESRQSPDEADDGPRVPPLASYSSRSPWAAEASDLDGLGDRNRSLSPEGDHVWDTLLTTLTPDPQPPSVGSSFASASASAAASQSTATAPSSRTSFTVPDRPEDDSAEPPCESGCENSDTEGDDEDDVDMMQLPLIPGLGASSSRRSRAGRNSTDDPLEYLGGIGGMQRIVRNLARREDIPDEWWADAGLSRTLPREARGS
ncbi:hypothetical protein VTJ49DRAFT_711 [Mycothermus thermophilus]|uniref:Uncharacterized protein n=1 Tax=Humicola insolens TaxID=85995 RepID=A0ABR3VG08_HUMIN